VAGEGGGARPGGGGVARAPRGPSDSGPGAAADSAALRGEAATTARRARRVARPARRAAAGAAVGNRPGRAPIKAMAQPVGGEERASAPADRSRRRCAKATRVVALQRRRSLGVGGSQCPLRLHDDVRPAARLRVPPRCCVRGNHGAPPSTLSLCELDLCPPVGWELKADTECSRRSNPNNLHTES